jgi:DNA-binding NtrC family response regulator/tetratricopeptide (TPR) repeat protein
MSVIRDDISRLFYAGEFGRIFELTRKQEPDTKTHPVLAALVAHATLEAGQIVRARAWAAVCTGSHHPAVRARGQLVTARCLRATGDISQATKLHQSALRSAEEANDDELAAWTAIDLLRHLFVTRRALAGTMVPAARVKTIRAGATHVTAYLHATVAFGEGQSARIEEARRHLQIAAELVNAKPHPWLECMILGTTAAIALASHDLSSGAAALQRFRTVAREHGFHSDYARATVNVGYLAMLTGQHDLAEQALKEGIESSHAALLVRLAATETFARVRLAQNRFRECQDLLLTIDDAAKESSLRQTDVVQGATLTRARLLLKRGDASAAIELLARLESTDGEPHDRPLAAAIKMTTAQALTMCRKPTEAAKDLAFAFRLHPTSIPELQGQFYYATAAAVSTSNPSLATSLRDRARRVWTSQGTVSLEREFPPDERGAGEGADTAMASASQLDAVAAVESMATLLALGSTPRVLVDEINETISRLGCSPQMSVAEQLEHASTSTKAMELVIPQRDNSAFKLVCAVPDAPDKVVALASVLRIGELALELERLREAERRRSALWPDASVEATAGAIFESDAMREVLTVARRVADTSVPVLITGETGTGKEVLARLIHGYSGRSKAAFAPFNCTSLSREMIESQLFGHRKGSFTGATDHSQGVVRAANHGTLLLDEIGDMPTEVQPKLLRFLESGEIHPLGEPRPIKVDVRVIAATNVDLKSRVSSGEFREDLYYRLSIVPLHLPPLRERRSEIPALASHYLAQSGREFMKGDLRLSEDAVEHLLLYRWPGNIRQLANEMRRIAAMAEVGAIVMPEHLSVEIVQGRRGRLSQREPQGNEILVRLDQPMAAAVEHIERAMIVTALEKSNGLVERAAQMLGLSRKGLYLKRQRYQIDIPVADEEFDAQQAE